MPTMKEVLEKWETLALIRERHSQVCDDLRACRDGMSPIYDSLMEVVGEMPHTDELGYAECWRCRLEKILGGKRST